MEIGKVIRNNLSEEELKIAMLNIAFTIAKQGKTNCNVDVGKGIAHFELQIK